MNETIAELDIRFEQFYAANFPRVKNFAKLLTKSEEDAEDIAQNIFLKLWTRPELWQDQETMTGYLYTVTRNEIFNLFKHQKVEQEYEDKVLKAQLLGELCDEDSSLWFFVKFGGTSSIVNKESWLSVVYFLPYCTSAFLPL